MLYLSDAEVTKLVDDDIPKVVELMRSMFLAMADGDYALGGKNGASHGMRISYGEHENNRMFIAMPGYLGGDFKTTGLKWHGPNTPLPGRNTDSNYTVVLNDSDTGEPFAIMRADNLTRYRTAAVNSLAVEYLLNKSPEVLSIIGPGRINSIFTKYILNKYKSINTIKVKGRGLESQKRFIQSIENAFPNIKIVSCGNVKDVILDADIVAVNEGLIFDNFAEMPRVKSSWVKPGCLFICSAYISFPDSMVISNSIKVCDMYKAYEAYEEELGYPAFRTYGALGNRFTDLVIEEKLLPDDMVDLADLVKNNKNIGKSDKPILFSNCGIVLEDIALASYVYKKAKAHNIGVEVV